MNNTELQSRISDSIFRPSAPLSSAGYTTAPFLQCIIVTLGQVLDRFPMKLSLAIGYVIQAFALLSLYYATSRPLAIITGCLLGANGGCLITCFRTVCCRGTRFLPLTMLLAGFYPYLTLSL